jgi:hypothetical protein
MVAKNLFHPSNRTGGCIVATGWRRRSEDAIRAEARSGWTPRGTIPELVAIARNDPVDQEMADIRY